MGYVLFFIWIKGTYLTFRFIVLLQIFRKKYIHKSEETPENGGFTASGKNMNDRNFLLMEQWHNADASCFCYFDVLGCINIMYVDIL